LVIEQEWTDAAGKERMEQWQATLDASKANDDDQIAWPDLSPIRVKSR